MGEDSVKNEIIKSLSEKMFPDREIRMSIMDILVKIWNKKNIEELKELEKNILLN